MKIDGKNFLVLYLEDWQMRMVKDFCGVDCHVWAVQLGKSPVVRYMVSTQTPGDTKRMYLTEWQRREITLVSGETCEFIELVKGAVTKYGVLPSEVMRQKV